jgi:hypothetical protein
MRILDIADLVQSELATVPHPKAVRLERRLPRAARNFVCKADPRNDTGDGLGEAAARHATALAVAPAVRGPEPDRVPGCWKRGAAGRAILASMPDPREAARMLRRIQWMALLLFGGMVGTACSDVLAIEEVVGVWETTSINGDAVPGTVVIDGLSYDVQFWRWTFNNGGICSTTSRIEMNEETQACEYSVASQQKIVVMDFGFATLQGVVDDDRMTITYSGDNVFVLRRQQ